MKVLVLGAGGAASNGFARALKLAGGYELVGTNCSETDLLLSDCDTNYLIGPVGNYEQWRVDLDRVIRSQKPDFVHAQNDAEVEALGQFRTVVHMHGAKTWLPAQEVIRLCRDKWASYERWDDVGVPVPRTVFAQGRIHPMARIFESFGEMWLRPAVGAGGQKSLSTSSCELACEWIAHHTKTSFTVAEALTSETVTVQQLYWNGSLLASQQRTRAAWANAGSSATGVSGSTGVGVTSSDAQADMVADLAVRAVDATPHGLYGIDMCRDADGVPNVTEINIGRFFTTVPEFFAQAGFNIADLYVKFGENAYYMHDCGMGWPDVPEPVRNPLPDGLRWIRGMDRRPVLA